MPSDFEEGLLVGILVGEGHFGGDGRQPHVTLRMHERHAPLFRWMERTVPGGRLYGPYDHGGRRYYQWMARGPFLRDVLVPILDRRLTPELDVYAHERFLGMKERYRRQLGAGLETGPSPRPPGPPPTDVTANTGGVPRGDGPPTRTGADPADRIFSSLRQHAPRRQDP